MKKHPTNYSPESYKHYIAPYDEYEINEEEIVRMAAGLARDMHRRWMHQHRMRIARRVTFVIGVLLGAGLIALLFS